MEKCSCYQETSTTTPLGRCLGTKEMEICTCRGNISKCDFYLEKSECMNTIDMINLAIKTGNTYKINDLLYNRELGFHDSRGRPWPSHAFNNLNDLMNFSTWEEDHSIYMTKSEAEKKYGIKIVGD